MSTEIYYYIRNWAGQLIATVCLIPEFIENRTVWYRGVALCSTRDQFSRKIGRKIAYGRAMMASLNKGNGKWLGKINTPVAKIVLPDIPFLFQRPTYEELTALEHQLISKLEAKL